MCFFQVCISWIWFWTNVTTYLFKSVCFLVVQKCKLLLEMMVALTAVEGILSCVCQPLNCVLIFILWSFVTSITCEAVIFWLVLEFFVWYQSWFRCEGLFTDVTVHIRWIIGKLDTQLQPSEREPKIIPWTIDNTQDRVLTSYKDSQFVKTDLRIGPTT